MQLSTLPQHPRAFARREVREIRRGAGATAFPSRHHLPLSPQPSSMPPPPRALSSSSSVRRPPLSSRRSAVLAAAALNTSLPVSSADVVVVGGGIIGLWCALSLLRSPENLSVALVEVEAETAGGGGGGGGGGATTARGTAPLPPLPRATGAGQGYLWLAHRPPGTPGWDFAVDSLAMWRAPGGMRRHAWPKRSG